MRGMWWLAGLLVAVGLLAAPAGARAHAEPVLGEPAAGASPDTAPAIVRLVLSAEVEAEFLSLVVSTAGGEVVSGRARRDPRDARAILAPVRGSARGTLLVRWRVLSRDGHPSGGAYAFAVGPATAPETGADVVRSGNAPLPLAARLLALCGPLGLVGLVVLAAGVVGPAVRAGGVVVPGEDPARVAGFREGAAAALAGSATAWRVAWWSLVGAWALGVALAPLAVLWRLREDVGELGALLGDTRFGQAWWVQLAGLALCVVASLALRRAATPPDRGAAASALAAGPLAALAAISWGGHASTGGDATANIAIDLAHSAATAAWIGGLLGLAALVTPALGRLRPDDRVRLAASVVVRFSALAMAAVAILVVTGVYRALAEVPVGDLLDTGYGRALLVKLALFAVLLCGGAYNRMVVHPRLERAALGLAAGDRGAAAALRVSVRAELAVAALLLVSVAVLAGLAPPA